MCHLANGVARLEQPVAPRRHGGACHGDWFFGQRQYRRVDAIADRWPIYRATTLVAEGHASFSVGGSSRDNAGVDGADDLWISWPGKPFCETYRAGILFAYI